MAPEALALGLPLPLAMAGQQIDDVPVAFLLDDLPDGDLTGAMVRFTSGNAAGHNVWIAGVRDGYVTTGIGQVHFDALRGVAAGDEVLIDNSAYLAFQTYHRHQVPRDRLPGMGPVLRRRPADLPAAPPSCSALATDAMAGPGSRAAASTAR